MDDKKKLWGRGIYGSKDVPIRVLDLFISGAIVVIIVFVVIFAMNGGFSITFDTKGGTEVTYQKIKYGEYVLEPSEVVKPGYELARWVTSDDETVAVEWSFLEDTVTEDMTLYAVWIPSQVTVKFDLDGGKVDGLEQCEDITVVYGECYSVLPIPEREGYSFEGWIYSGNVITTDSKVEATGEHVLTALWSVD